MRDFVSRILIRVINYYRHRDEVSRNIVIIWV